MRRIYLTDSSYLGPRRISALLVLDDAVIEEQGVAVGADERRHEFEFGFAKTPRPAGAYQIKFVEIARSNGNNGSSTLCGSLSVKTTRDKKLANNSSAMVAPYAHCVICRILLFKRLPKEI